jgi:ADP-ribose pyrophosphatase YjhB (NUDIX family)
MSHDHRSDRMDQHDSRHPRDLHDLPQTNEPHDPLDPTDPTEAVEANHHLQHRYPLNVRFCALCGGAMRMRVVLPDRKRFMVCDNCGFVHFPGPKLVAGCLVVDGGRVLLLRRGNEPRIGTWTGGYVDLGETPAQAATRETLEEVGMRVTTDGLLGVYADAQNPITAVVVYMARPGAERPSVSSEATEIKYFAADEIPWDDLSFRTTHDALRDWVTLAGKYGA